MYGSWEMAKIKMLVFGLLVGVLNASCSSESGKMNFNGFLGIKN